jgi:hypothetical protein
MTSGCNDSGIMSRRQSIRDANRYIREFPSQRRESPLRGRSSAPEDDGGTRLLTRLMAHLPVDDARSHGRFGSGSWHHLAGASMAGSVQSTAANDDRLASTDGRARSVEQPARMASASAAAIRSVMIVERITAGSASAVPSVTRSIRPRLPRN